MLEKHAKNTFGPILYSIVFIVLITTVPISCYLSSVLLLPFNLSLLSSFVLSVLLIHPFQRKTKQLNSRNLKKIKASDMPASKRPLSELGVSMYLYVCACISTLIDEQFVMKTVLTTTAKTSTTNSRHISIEWNSKRVRPKQLRNTELEKKLSDL